MKKLGNDFYRREDVLQVAADLLGKILVTNRGGTITSGRIVETEAYNGVVDKASHAWNGRRTARNEIMYAAGGVSYVYLCYGIHHLFNVVTGRAGIPHAVLIRALEPVAGTALMLQRTGKTKAGHRLASGPGNLSKALGIQTVHSGLSLLGKELFIADDGYTLAPGALARSPRIGVDYAGADAKLPYRFFIKGHPGVSGKKNMQ